MRQSRATTSRRPPRRLLSDRDVAVPTAKQLTQPLSDLSTDPPTWPRVRAAVVHVFTASGAFLAFLFVLAAIEGDEARALWLGLAALVIDGTDGMLARRFQVKRWIPWFDGALLDNIVDYLTYVFAPVILLHQSGYLPSGAAGSALAALPLLASTYQFCRVDAKTEDHLFLGFPSYWNVVAFYAIVLDLPTAAVVAVIVVCTVLVFVPIGYLYPSRTDAFWQLNIAMTVAWLGAYAVIVAQLPEPSPVVVGFSLLYIGYYLVVSVYLTTISPGARARRAAANVGD